MKIFKKLNNKGYKHYYEGTVEELDSMDKDNQHLHSEIMQVIMWLYEKHGVWIHPEICFDGKSFVPKITKVVENLYPYDTQFNSPTEAYQAAIEYCLNNLIK